MPELPEVETTLRGIAPHLIARRIDRVIVREPRLRQPIPPNLAERVSGQNVLSVSRRSKYLLIGLDQGCLLIHLGMSGSLRVVAPDRPPRKHDHVDLILSDGRCLRFHDPRRFGLILWTTDPPEVARERHPLLEGLGPEPFDPAFDGTHLHRLASHRRVAVKSFIMDASVVVGVGNIYASESLFLARIHPNRGCHRIGLARYQRLAQIVRDVLEASIARGGTTLRDFVREDGHPGYFAQSLQVYGRAGEPCTVCGTPLRQQRIGQRSSVYCPRCQH
jgi:formamidopyrimidine-DNA glycosylase